MTSKRKQYERFGNQRLWRTSCIRSARFKHQIELESESGNGDSDLEARRSRATCAELGGAENALD